LWALDWGCGGGGGGVGEEEMAVVVVFGMGSSGEPHGCSFIASHPSLLNLIDHLANHSPNRAFSPPRATREASPLSMPGGPRPHTEDPQSGARGSCAPRQVAEPLPWRHVCGSGGTCRAGDRQVAVRWARGGRRLGAVGIRWNDATGYGGRRRGWARVVASGHASVR